MMSKKSLSKTNKLPTQKQSWSVRSLYAYFSIPQTRKMFLKKLDKGLGITSKIGDLPKFDKREDEISRNVLKNWRELDIQTRHKYCQMILDNSIKGQVWALNHKEELLQKIKSKLKFWEKKDE